MPTGFTYLMRTCPPSGSISPASARQQRTAWPGSISRERLRLHAARRLERAAADETAAAVAGLRVLERAADAHGAVLLRRAPGEVVRVEQPARVGVPRRARRPLRSGPDSDDLPEVDARSRRGRRAGRHAGRAWRSGSSARAGPAARACSRSTWPWIDMSSADVGSSMTTSAGRVASARPMAARWSSPPLTRRGLSFAKRGLRPTSVSSSSTRPSASRPPAEPQRPRRSSTRSSARGRTSRAGSGTPSARAAGACRNARVAQIVDLFAEQQDRVRSRLCAGAGWCGRASTSRSRSRRA